LRPLRLLLASVGVTRRSGVARDADRAGCASRALAARQAAASVD